MATLLLLAGRIIRGGDSDSDDDLTDSDDYLIVHEQKKQRTEASASEVVEEDVVEVTDSDTESEDEDIARRTAVEEHGERERQYHAELIGAITKLKGKLKTAANARNGLDKEVEQLEDKIYEREKELNRCETLSKEGTAALDEQMKEKRHSLDIAQQDFDAIEAEILKQRETIWEQVPAPTMRVGDVFRYKANAAILSGATRTAVVSDLTNPEKPEFRQYSIEKGGQSGQPGLPDSDIGSDTDAETILTLIGKHKEGRRGMEKHEEGGRFVSTKGQKDSPTSIGWPLSMWQKERSQRVIKGDTSDARSVNKTTGAFGWRPVRA